MRALLAMRVAQSLDDRPSIGVSARPREPTCRGSSLRRQPPTLVEREVSPRRGQAGTRALRRSGPWLGAGGLGGGAFALRGPCDAGKHRRGIAVQDLLAGF